jgi:hypothetical protein
MKTKSTPLFALFLATATFAMAQTPNAGSIESQLRDLRAEKTRVTTSYSQLAAYNPYQISLESHLDNLGVIKESVNRAGSIVSKLESQRSVMSPAQQTRFDEFKSQTAAVAGLTNELLLQIRNDRFAFRTVAFNNSVKEAYIQATGARNALNKLIATSTAISMPSAD